MAKLKPRRLHRSKPSREKVKACDPVQCDHCAYIGEGDFICDLNGMGPDTTVFVMDNWSPTEHYLQCQKGGHQ